MPVEKFSIRAKKFVNHSLQQRIVMIKQGWNRKPNADTLLQQCEILKEQLNNLYSDQQLADFIFINYWIIENALPGKEYNKAKLTDLLTEAENIK